MSWKRVITGSGDANNFDGEGRVLPQDLVNHGLSAVPPEAADVGKVLKILNTTDNGTLTWAADEAYAHPNNYTAFDVGINTAQTHPVSADGWVISNLTADLETDTSGHVTLASAAVNRREMTLADLGYTGAADANKYEHPLDYTSNEGYAQSIDISLNNDQVLRSLLLERTTNAAGHVQHHLMNYTTGTISLEDLGYFGDPQADQYDHWKVQVGSDPSVPVTSGDSVKFKAGANLSLESEQNAGVNTITISAAPAGIGQIMSVTAGSGMDFVAGGDEEPDVVISMAEPDDISASSQNTNPTGGGHSHNVITTSDGSVNGSTETLLTTDASGGLTVENLTVASTLSVAGDEVVLGSSEVQIEDNSIQLNYDVANSQYNTGGSAIIFGNNDFAVGGKIINHVSGTGQHFMAFSDLSSDLNANNNPEDNAAEGGTANLGDAAKSIKTGPVSIEGRLICNQVTAASAANIGTTLTVGNILRLSPQNSEPAATNDGEMYFDGSNLWINT